MRTGGPTFGDARIDTRNPANQVLGGIVTGVAPHALTTRAAYTVPSGKRALVASVFVEAMRETAAAPAGVASCEAFETPIVGTAQRILAVSDIAGANGVGQRLAMGMSNVLVPTEAVSFRTSDASTGGTYRYTAGIALSEFDP